MATRICMAVYDTIENKRTEYTKRTLESLLKTVDFNTHKLFISDNNSCEETRSLYSGFVMDAILQQKAPLENFFISLNETNVGTALAINKGMALRDPGQFVIKIDNDVVIHKAGWVDEMEEAIKRNPKIGILGLKRKDLQQSPFSDNPSFRSKIEMLPHEHGQRWIIVEYASDIMGTCVMFNYALMDKIGGLKQPGIYGWDDVDYSTRSRLANFENAFLPHIEIEHIDVGGDEYCKEKRRLAAQAGEERLLFERGYANGTIPLYVEPLK